MTQEKTFYAIELATFAGQEYAVKKITSQVMVMKDQKEAEAMIGVYPRSRVVPVKIIPANKDQDKKDGPALIYDEEYVKSLHGKVLELRQTCLGHLSTIDVLQNQLNASRRTIADLEERLSLQRTPPDRTNQLEGDVEQLRAQLAACLAAAVGAKPETVYYHGHYLWSPAYQATLNVRRRCDSLEESHKLLEVEAAKLRDDNRKLSNLDCNGQEDYKVTLRATLERNRSLHVMNDSLIMKNQQLHAEAVGLKAGSRRECNRLLHAALTSLYEAVDTGIPGCCSLSSRISWLASTPNEAEKAEWHHEEQVGAKGASIYIRNWPRLSKAIEQAKEALGL